MKKPRAKGNPLDLKALRQKRGLTQEQASRLVGCSFVTWSRWETGKCRPQPVMLARIREVLQKKNAK